MHWQLARQLHQWLPNLLFIRSTPSRPKFKWTEWKSRISPMFKLAPQSPWVTTITHSKINNQERRNCRPFSRSNDLCSWRCSCILSLHHSLWKSQRIFKPEKGKSVVSQFFQNYPSFAHLFAGFCAEIGSCLVWLPIDIIKERLQVQS